MLEHSKWIACKTAYGTVCPIFEKNFTIKKAVKSANIQITAIGVYKAYINDKNISDYILAPGWTNYDKRIQVQSEDITDLLETENKLRIFVGEGWHLGRLTWTSEHVYSAKQPAVILKLEIIYQDGEKEIIVSDESFKCAKSGILFSSIYDGEIYDSSKKDYEFEDVKIIDYTKDTLIPQEGEKIKEIERIKPVAHTKNKTKDDILDFGQNLTGYVEFKCNAPKGTVIEIYHGEILDEEGDVYTANLRSAKQRILYIANGEESVYKPSFTFQGFRYIRIVNWQGELNENDFTAISVHSDLKRTGYFSCSNEKLNKLYSNIIWGQRDNYLDVPTDCPQRDERLGWTGDAEVFIKTASYNFDVKKFFTKWLNDLFSEQFEDGGVPAVIPNVLGKETASSSAWGDAAVICPWQLYLSYGDKDILEQYFPGMEKWINYIKNQGDNLYLWNTGHHFGDWLALDAPYGSYEGSTEKSLIATAYYAYSTSLLIKAGKVLNKDMSEYEELYKAVKAEFNKTFKKGERLTSDTQTAYTLAIHFNLCEEKLSFGNRLAELIEKNGNRLETGFVGTTYLLHALTETGHSDLAYSLILQEKFPSWLYSVNQGATTVWEHWDGIDDMGKIWNAAMNSFNHYAYGSVCDWMYEAMAGIIIDENAPAFKNIIFKPFTDLRIDNVSASIDTAFGKVKSSWIREGDRVNYTFEVPKGASATIVLNNKTETIGAGVFKYTV